MSDSSPRSLFAFALGAAAEYLAVLVLRFGSWAATHRVRTWLLAAALCLCGLLAVAQDSAGSSGGAAPASPPSVSSTYATGGPTAILGRIAGSIERAVQRLQGNAALQSAGTLISGFFLIALMVWGVIKTKISGRGLADIFGEWVPVWVSFGLVYAFLSRGLGQQIESTMNSLSGVLGGPTSLQNAFTVGADPMFRAMGAVLEMPVASLSMSTLLAAIPATIGAVIAKVFAMGMLGLATVVMMGHLIFAQVSVGIVLAFAPIMVPFLMWQPTKMIFDGWLKFLITACLLKVVAGLMLSIAALILAEMSTTAAQIAAESRGSSGVETLMIDMLQMGMLLVFSALAALLMAMSPSLANGLMSGSGGHGFSGIKGLAKSAGGAAAVAPLAPGAAGVAGAARMAGQNLANRAAYSAGVNRGAAKLGQDFYTRAPAQQRHFDRGLRDGKPPEPPATP